MNIIITLLLMARPSHASVKAWCTKMLTSLAPAEDPYPLAEVSSPQLLVIYDNTDSTDALRELLFRTRAHMLTEFEVIYFNQLLDRNHK